MIRSSLIARLTDSEFKDAVKTTSDGLKKSADMDRAYELYRKVTDYMNKEMEDGKYKGADISMAFVYIMTGHFVGLPKMSLDKGRGPQHSIETLFIAISAFNTDVLNHVVNHLCENYEEVAEYIERINCE